MRKRIYGVSFLLPIVALFLGVQTDIHADPVSPTVYVAGDGSGDYNCDGESDQVEINQALKFAASHSGFTTVYLKGSNTYLVNEPIAISNVSLCFGAQTALHHVPVPPTVYVAGDGSGDYNCDGESDQVEINQALEFVASHSGFTTVYLKGKNTYLINEPIVIASNTHLKGDSTAKVQLEDYVGWELNKPMIRQKGVEHWNESLHNAIYGTEDDYIENVEISGFEITAGNQNAEKGTWAYIIIMFYRASGITVHDMYIHDSYSDMIRILNQSDMTGDVKSEFYNNHIVSSGHEGFYLGFISEVAVYSNKIYTTRTNNGIRIEECEKVSAYGNTIGNSFENEPSGYAGIYLRNTNRELTSAEICDNYIFGKTVGIVLTGDDNNQDSVHVHHNKIYKIVHYEGREELHGAIRIYGSRNTIIESNTIVGSDAGGIIFESSSGSETGNTTIVRNNIICNVMSGYAIDNRASGEHSFICKNNDLYNNTSNYNNASSSNDIYEAPLFVNIPIVPGDPESSNKWHYVVGTYDNTAGFKIYVDGSLQGSNTNVYGDIKSPATGDFSALSLGSYLGMGEYHELAGNLDEIALWDRALSAEEVSTLWNNGNGNIITGDLCENLKIYLQMENNWNDNNGVEPVEIEAEFTTDAKLGSYAGKFSGSNNYVNYPGDILTNAAAITVAAWIKVNIKQDSMQTIISKGYQERNDHIWFYTLNNKVFFELGFPDLNSRDSVASPPIEAGDIDFHLKSEFGHWHSDGWIQDQETSPCIDRGDPESDYSEEPLRNGGRINIGLYGNTPQASKSPN